MHRIVLVKLRLFINLAHQDNDGRHAAKKRIAIALVGLPCADEVRYALLKELAVDLDVRHDGQRLAMPWLGLPIKNRVIHCLRLRDDPMKCGGRAKRYVVRNGGWETVGFLGELVNRGSKRWG